jgi:hypothetical protein
MCPNEATARATLKRREARFSRTGGHCCCLQWYILTIPASISTHRGFADTGCSRSSFSELVKGEQPGSLPTDRTPDHRAVQKVVRIEFRQDGIWRIRFCEARYGIFVMLPRKTEFH